MTDFQNPWLLSLEAEPLRGVDSEEEEPIGTIQGQKARSRNEWHVAQALFALRHEFMYQYPVFGARGVRGEFFLDFLVLTTAPRPTPLEVLGDRWHTGSLGREDRHREIVINDVGRERGWNEVVYLFEQDTRTEAAAYEAIVRELGRA